MDYYDSFQTCSRENDIMDTQISTMQFQQLSTPSQSCFIYTLNIFCCTCAGVFESNSRHHIIPLLRCVERPKRFRKAVSGRAKTFHTLRCVWLPYRKWYHTCTYTQSACTHTDAPKDEPLAPIIYSSPTPLLSHPILCSLWRIHTHSWRADNMLGLKE